MTLPIDQITEIGKVKLTPWTEGDMSTTGDETSLSTTDGGDRIGKPAAFDDCNDVFLKQIVIAQDSSFRIKPYTITSGPLKGCQAIILVPAGSFRFLDLPVELRSIIYGYLIPESSRIRLVTSKGSGNDCDKDGRRVKRGKRIVGGPFSYQKDDRREELWGDDSESISQKYRGEFPDVLSLLEVNKQIHDEVIELVYSSNPFQFKSARDLRLFIKTSKYAERIRHVVLFARDLKNVRQSLRNLQYFPNLRVVEFDHSMVCNRGYGHLREYGQNAEQLVAGFLPVLNTIRASLQKQGVGERKILEAIRFKECSCWVCSYHKGRNGSVAKRYSGCADECFSEQEKLAEDIKKVISRRFLGIDIH